MKRLSQEIVMGSEIRVYHSSKFQSILGLTVGLSLLAVGVYGIFLGMEVSWFFGVVILMSLMILWGGFATIGVTVKVDKFGVAKPNFIGPNIIYIGRISSHGTFKHIRLNTG